MKDGHLLLCQGRGWEARMLGDQALCPVSIVPSLHPLLCSSTFRSQWLRSSQHCRTPALSGCHLICGSHLRLGAVVRVT